MRNFPWLTALIVVPLVGAVVVWLVPGPVRRYARQVALGIGLLVFAATVAMALNFDTADAASQQFTTVARWIPQFGVSYAVGVNGVGLVMILLATLLVPLVIAAGWWEHGNPVTSPRAAARSAHYAALVLVLEAFMVAVFAARDVFFFYLVFEAMLIPVYFLIGSFGGVGRKAAALKFLLYSLAGGLIMLAGVIALWAQGPRGPGAFLIDTLVAEGTGLGASAERLVFLAFFVAFAIKAPMFPVHTWLPDTAQAATPGTSVLLVGVLDKVGTFGMIVLCLPLFPAASAWAAPVIIVLAVISVLYGAFLAIGSKDILRLIAYTSISHFGFIILGIFAFTATSEVGASFYMLNHGLATGALFFLAGALITRRGTGRIDQLGGGLQRTTPLLAGTFLVVGLAAIALPGLSPFISEFLVIVGSFEATPVAAVVAAGGVILAALYILLTYQKVFTGPPRHDLAATPDLGKRELMIVAPLIAIMLVLGFWPKPGLDLLQAPAGQVASVASLADSGVGGPSGTEEGGQQ